MDKTKKYLMIAFIVILSLVTLISIIGIILLKPKELVLQGQIEAAEIRISGKLPGRIESFYIKQGDSVVKGDTLVRISSPEGVAKLSQVSALQNIATAQSDKIDQGNRKQLVESFFQLWNKSKSDLDLATTTYKRISTLSTEGVVTLQRQNEAQAVYKAAIAAERVAYQQYQIALEGARNQDKMSAHSLINATQAVVNQVNATLQDAVLLAPRDGQIASIYLKEEELVGQGMPIMNLIALDDAHVVLNIREDLLYHFQIGTHFKADIPALNKKQVVFVVNYINPLGSYATWKSTKESGSYDMVSFELHAIPESAVQGLRPGMSVLIKLDDVYE